VIKNSPCGNASMEAEKIFGHNRTYLFENILLDRLLPDDLGKLQIHGHTPLMCFNPVFFPEINSWNLDTGAYLGWGMSAIRINDKGDVLNTFFERTGHRDINCSFGRRLISGIMILAKKIFYLKLKKLRIKLKNGWEGQ